MLVSAVLDPSAFDKAGFDKPYAIQAKFLLKGIQRNGLLIVDQENRLPLALIKKVESIPPKYQKGLQTLVEELVVKKESKRIIKCSVPESCGKSLLDLAYCLKTNTEVDALIVGDDSYLEAADRGWTGLVPLSEYSESKFEKIRENYETHNTPIDKLPKSKVKDFIRRSVRFSKRLGFYDPYIGRGDNTSDFLKGIEYILSLWDEHGFFAQSTRSVEIFTCCKPRKWFQWNTQWQRQIQEQKMRIDQELIGPLKEQFPCCSVEFSIKIDQNNRIFHARFLETEHVTIGVDPGFDFFIRNEDEKFKRTLFTPNMVNASHLKEYSDLPDAPV